MIVRTSSVRMSGKNEKFNHEARARIYLRKITRKPEFETDQENLIFRPKFSSDFKGMVGVQGFEPWTR